MSERGPSGQNFSMEAPKDLPAFGSQTVQDKMYPPSDLDSPENVIWREKRLAKQEKLKAKHEKKTGEKLSLVEIRKRQKERATLRTHRGLLAGAIVTAFAVGGSLHRAFEMPPQQTKERGLPEPTKGGHQETIRIRSIRKLSRRERDGDYDENVIITESGRRIKKPEGWDELFGDSFERTENTPEERDILFEISEEEMMETIDELLESGIVDDAITFLYESGADVEYIREELAARIYHHYKGGGVIDLTFSTISALTEVAELEIQRMKEELEMKRLEALQ